ncbi:MAG: ribosome maturation factor RimM [Acetobacteraceae bacterium]
MNFGIGTLDLGATGSHRVLVGRIGRPFGVGGLVHLTSYTEEPCRLAKFSPLTDEAGRHYRIAWVADGIARLFAIEEGEERPVSNRGAAEALTNRGLFLAREALPAAANGEFYLADLIGLEAYDQGGAALGRVVAVHDYGAGASLEIGSLLIPFTRAAVPEIDLARHRIVVSPPVVVNAR